jgi:hypothetical protein
LSEKALGHFEGCENLLLRSWLQQMNARQSISRFSGMAALCDSETLGVPTRFCEPQGSEARRDFVVQRDMFSMPEFVDGKRSVEFRRLDGNDTVI